MGGLKGDFFRWEELREVVHIGGVNKDCFQDGSS